MEVINRAKQTFQFKVLKSFSWVGKMCKVGEILESIPEPQVTELVALKKVEPLLPEFGVYICLRTITLPGAVKKHEATRMQRIELKSSDALKLLLENAVVPESNLIWRPYGRKLKTDRQAPPGRRRQ